MPKDIQKRWVKKASGDPNLINELANKLNTNKSLANILVQRGIATLEDAKLFFRPSLNDLHDPFLMKDMDRAVERILKAIEEGENILVYGDYDVDGTTAVALTYSFLTSFYDKVSFYIPDRYKEGYGISFAGIDFAANNDISLIIALDCGIKSNDKIDYANDKNIDFIICDHHTPGDKIPNAIVLDPKRNDCNYPYKELSGCGIGFKLTQAIASRKNISNDDVFKLLDLVTISTAADIVSITGENRILCFYGLKQLNDNARPGVNAIMTQAGKTFPVDISDLVFTIAPRINAAGRIHSGQHAVELLVEGSKNIAQTLSEELGETNDQRKNLDKEITQQALSMIESNAVFKNLKTTVLYNENWHKGVIGIVASRVMETYYRPTIMLTSSNGKATGSARSVRDFDIYEAIDKCSDLLEQFGGHKYAAGLTMDVKNVEAFQKKFEKIVNETIHPDLLIPMIEIDDEISFETIFEKGENTNEVPKFYRVLKQLGPFGPENMNPVFRVNNVIDTGYSKVVGEDHLKLYICTKENTSIKLNGIAFGMGHLLKEIQNKSFDIVFTLEENYWNEKTTIQLAVKDIQFSH